MSEQLPKDPRFLARLRRNLARRGGALLTERELRALVDCADLLLAYQGTPAWRERRTAAIAMLEALS